MSRATTSRKSIVVIQLQHDIPSRSLKTRAIAEVLAKTLYQNQSGPLSASRLASKAAGLAELSQIPQGVVDGGLKWLRENGWAVEEGSKGWKLSTEGHGRIENRHNESEDRISYILQKHFGTSIEASTLRQWFLQASITFFAQFGDVISRALLREPVNLPERSRLESLLEQSVAEAGLSDKRDLLITGFHKFLDDIDPRAEAQKMSFALAKLSARLIAAAAGPDPLAVPEFENSRLFLDTNVLLLVRVEAGAPGMSKALAALAKALNSIGASLHIIRPTKDEYDGVVIRKRTETLKVLAEGASFGVLERAADPFLKTAIKNGARTEEDFKRFFDSISDAPSSVESIPISLLESSELQTVIEKAKASPKRAEISAEWKRLRGKEKRRTLAEHDAALDATALFYREKEGKGWVLTRDRSMLNLSRRWHEHEGLPAWVYLEALVDILAAYGTGPTYKPEEFAPLLGALIRSDVQETLGNFQVEDLGELVDMDARVFELNDDEVVSFALKVHQMKLTGEDEDSAELQLHMRRTFQGRRLADNDAAEKARAEVRKRELKVELTREIGISALTKAIIPKIRWRRRKRWIPYLIIGAILFLGIYLAWKYNSEPWLISLAIAVVVDLGIPLLQTVIAGDNGASIEEEAKREAERDWESQSSVRMQ